MPVSSLYNQLNERGICGLVLNFFPLLVLEVNTLDQITALSALVLNLLTGLSILVVIILNIKRIFKNEK